MRVVVTLEQRFVVYAGQAYCPAVAAYEFWNRYRDRFSDVVVVGRAADVDCEPVGWRRVDGPGVVFVALPNYLGLFAFVKNLVRTAICSYKIVETFGKEAFIFRVPAASSFFIWLFQFLRGRPYSLEIVGDPYASIRAISRNPLAGAVLAHLGASLLRLQVFGVNGPLSYVTSRALQKAYPAGVGVASFSVSDVILPKPSSKRRLCERPKPPFSLIYVGTLDQLYKGQEVLLRAFKLVRGRIECKLEIVGGGCYKGYLQDLANNLGVGGDVKFVGQLNTPSEIVQHLEAADLFVLPSYTEGLPRAMLEALSLGVPCVGSAVGGIPELLPPNLLVEPGRIDILAAKIISVLQDSTLRNEMAIRGPLVASQYSSDTIVPVRRAFLDEVFRSSVAGLHL